MSHVRPSSLWSYAISGGVKSEEKLAKSGSHGVNFSIAILDLGRHRLYREKKDQEGRKKCEEGHKKRCPDAGIEQSRVAVKKGKITSILAMAFPSTRKQPFGPFGEFHEKEQKGMAEWQNGPFLCQLKGVFIGHWPLVLHY